MIPRELGVRLLGREGSVSRIGGEVTRGDGAMRILEDDSREAYLRKLECEATGDGGLGEEKSAPSRIEQ